MMIASNCKHYLIICCIDQAPTKYFTDFTSFGSGLIVKQALIEARKRKDEPSFLSIYENTHAVIFFGTPHRGSSVASWARLLSSIAQAAQMDTSDSILTDLDPESGSSKLEELRLDFDDVLQDSQRARELRVFSFQEAKGMTGINLLGNKVGLLWLFDGAPRTIVNVC